MKKLLSILLAATLTATMFAGCSSEPEASTTSTSDSASTSTPTEPTVTEIDSLTIGFVPSRDPEEIVTATEPLKALLQAELLKVGYDVKEVEITVGTSYEVVGQGLVAGTIDIGLIPGSTYVLYDDGAEVILTATRDALSIDSDNAKDWNDNKPTAPLDNQTVSYRSLIIAGPSEKGQALAAKVNAGEELTWDDVNAATWNVMSSTSPAGYVYPSIWLQENYEKSIGDLSNAVKADSYGSAFARLAAGQTDIMLIYADARRDNEAKWTEEFGRTASIWDETNVIGVTPGIYNDTICVSKNSDVMDDGLKVAITDSFINIGDTAEGKEVISIYNHNGYQIAKASDYDDERTAQEMIKALNAG